MIELALLAAIVVVVALLVLLTSRKGDRRGGYIGDRWRW